MTTKRISLPFADVVLQQPRAGGDPALYATGTLNVCDRDGAITFKVLGLIVDSQQGSRWAQVATDEAMEQRAALAALVAHAAEVQRLLAAA